MSTDGMSSWPTIEPPNMILPVSGGNLSYLSINTLTSTGFVASACGDTHLSTDWEIRSAPNGGGSLAWFSTNDIINKVSVTVVALTLAPASTYYARCRYKSTIRTSVWCEDRPFTTT